MRTTSFIVLIEERHIRSQSQAVAIGTYSQHQSGHGPHSKTIRQRLQRQQVLEFTPAFGAHLIEYTTERHRR